MGSMDMNTTIAWHTLSENELLKKLETGRDGLSEKEARLRLERYGFNRLEKKKEYRAFSILIRQLRNPFVLILAAAGLAAFFLGHITDAGVIFIAIAINTSIGFLQEGRASKTFDRLNERIARRAVVIREGQKKEIPSETLVPGDVFVAEGGDWISADARILEAGALKVNEAALTGEWIPVEKFPDVISQENARVTSRRNMVFAGTLIEQGHATFVAVATRMETELGRISLLVEQAKNPPTPLQKGISRLARVIAVFVVVITGIIFILGFLRGENITQMFLMAVAISVASVPEGLPIVVTVILAIGMERILKRRGLVKNLLAAETLGSCDVILTDKTGTLTEANMRVSHVVGAIETLNSESSDFYTKLSHSDTGHMRTLIAATATSNAFVENQKEPIDAWHIRGEPMHRAMIIAGAKAGIRLDSLLLSQSRIDVLPFDSERRFAASLNKGNTANTLFVAGAPELLIEISSHIYENGACQEFTPILKHLMLEKQKEIIQSGARMIASAYKEVNENKIVCNPNSTPCIRDTVFLGLIAFHDPIRKDVPAAIRHAQSAGLRPVVVTGDHRLTAEYVSKKAGISITKKNVLQGEELDAIDEKEFRGRVHEFDLYTRVLPHQKMKIVGAWQSRGAVVAMTGDGVNDAPALKQADVGIAVGSGTEVAKEASDLVLLNDSFSVIVAAIGEGRVIADNIRKSITLLLSTTFSEIVLIGGALVAGLPIPILPAQILWTNLIEEGFLSFAYAFEPGEGDVLKHAPRKKMKDSIFTDEMIFLIFGAGTITSLFLFGVYLAMLYLGYSIGHIRTIAFAGVALDALFFVFSLRSLRRPIWKIRFFGNPVLLSAVGISILFLFGALTLDPLRRLLTLVPLSADFYLFILGLGILNLISIEAAKWFFIRKKIAE